MQRELSFERRFEKDIVRQKRRGKDLDKVDIVSFLLARDGKLTSAFHPHKLSGMYEGLWECHLEHDWLLVYKINDTEVILARTGSHSDLFE